MAGDLHIHTKFSDGRYSPQEIILMAKKLNISTIAITDHDTNEGLAEGAEYAEKLKIDFIPGIEFSTLLNDTEVHILGYYIDYQKGILQEKIAYFKSAREKRLISMINKLQNLGYNLDLNELQNSTQSKVLGRVHIAILLKNKGYFSSIEDVFQSLLNYGCPAYVPREKLQVQEAIRLIHELNGIAILAHPGLILKEELVEKVLDLGINGLEVFYPLHNQEKTEYYLNLCKKNKLLITGGSDFHGVSSKSRNCLGAAMVDDSNLAILKEYYMNNFPKK